MRGDSGNGRGSGKIAANGEKVAGFKGASPSPSASASAPPERPAHGLGVRETGSVSTGGGKEEEQAWKRTEEALQAKERSVRQALKEKQKTLQQVRTDWATYEIGYGLGRQAKKGRIT